MDLCILQAYRWVLLNRSLHTDVVVLTPQPDDFKVPKWICYMVITQVFEYKTVSVYLGIYLRLQSKWRDSFVSNWNEYAEFCYTSIVNTHPLKKGMHKVYCFTLNILVLF